MLPLALPKQSWLLLSVLFLSAACNLADSVGDVGLSQGGEIKLVGHLPGEAFGTAVDFIGDLNGDGQGDIAVGAPGNTTSGTDAGAVYVFLSPLSSDMVGIKISGVAGDALGNVVLGPGDLDADGLDDLVLAAPGNQRVYLFRGVSGVGLNAVDAVISVTQANLTITATTADFSGSTPERFGMALSSAGDLNHDGRLDLAIAAESSDARGLLYVFMGGLSLANLGSSTALSIPSQLAELKLRGEGGTGSLVINHAGDVNDDFGASSTATNKFGDDLLVGAPQLRTIYWLPGVAGVAGNLEITSYPLNQRLEFQDKSDFGQSLAATGDLNQDGIDDIAVGYANGVRLFQGFAQIGLLSAFSYDIASTTPGDGLGRALGGGRGALVAGQPGIALGAALDGLAALDAGAAYFASAAALSGHLVQGSILSASAGLFRLYRGFNHAPNLSRLLGKSIKYGGDINNDRRSDLLLGMPGYSGNGSRSGGVLVEF